MNTRNLLMLLSLALIVSCTIEEDKPAPPPPPAKEKLTGPFRFHKAIEVKPGLTLDILSWGRGSESAGAYLILRSDSTHLKYRSYTGELDGQIKDVWDMDMDSDGNPELYIQAEGVGEGSHLSMYVYEFSSDGNAREIRFPELGSASQKGYKGQDSIYISDGKIIREFPVFAETDAGKPSGGRKKLEYSLRNNSFNVKEVKED